MEGLIMPNLTNYGFTNSNRPRARGIVFCYECDHYKEERKWCVRLSHTIEKSYAYTPHKCVDYKTIKKKENLTDEEVIFGDIKKRESNKTLTM